MFSFIYQCFPGIQNTCISKFSIGLTIWRVRLTKYSPKLYSCQGTQAPPPSLEVESLPNCLVYTPFQNCLQPWFFGFDSITMIIVMIIIMIIMTVIVMISIMIVSTIIRTLGTPHHSLREPKLPPHTCFWQFSLESIFHNMKRHIFLSLLLPPLHYYLHHH